MNIRLGLCCKFQEEPIKFYTTTARYLRSISTKEAKVKLSNLCFDNANSLLNAIEFCHNNGIGSFRINSKILPLKTHPEFVYRIEDLPNDKKILSKFIESGKKAKQYGIRLSFHPDQFILLSSFDNNITKKSILELEYQMEVCELVKADVINIHGGGGYGDKKTTLKRLEKTLNKLDDKIRKKLTLENDDRIYTPYDLLPFCKNNNIPFVYDIHHHRCLKDSLSESKVTEEALKTWDREPLFHLSSPKFGWNNKNIRFHADYININDFPDIWRNLPITIEVEAKAKELAVLKLQKQLI